MRNIKELIVSLSILFIFIPSFVYSDSGNELQLLRQFRAEQYKDKEIIINDIKNKEFTIDQQDIIIESFKVDIDLKQKYIIIKMKDGLSKEQATDLFNREYVYKNYNKYISNQAKFISKFHNKKSVAPLLIGLKDYGSTVYTPLFIINIGEQAVDNLLSFANSSDPLLRSNAFFVLSVWINAPLTTEHYEIPSEMKLQDKNNISKIRKLFIYGLNDNFIDVRLRSLYGLGAFPDKLVISEIEKLATSDPYYESSIGVYPIRENANAVLDILKEKIKTEKGDGLIFGQ